MSTATLEMHRDHEMWSGEGELWRDDLALWEHEINQAIEELPQLEEALRHHAQRLRQHAASARLYAKDAAACEHSLADHERGEINPPMGQLAKAHQRVALKHAVQRKAHEKIKRSQHELMAKWNILVTALRNPKSGNGRMRLQTASKRPK